MLTRAMSETNAHSAKETESQTPPQTDQIVPTAIPLVGTSSWIIFWYLLFFIGMCKAFLTDQLPKTRIVTRQSFISSVQLYKWKGRKLDLKQFYYNAHKITIALSMHFIEIILMS